MQPRRWYTQLLVPGEPRLDPVSRSRITECHQHIGEDAGLWPSRAWSDPPCTAEKGSAQGPILVALHTVCTTEWMWNFYSEQTADGREGRTGTSSEQCRESRTMSRVVVVVFRGRQHQKPQIASVLRSHHDPVRQECLRVNLTHIW